MHDHIVSDLEKIEDKKNGNGGLEMVVDEDGNKVNLLEEIVTVQDDLQYILVSVNDLKRRNKDI